MRAQHCAMALFPKMFNLSILQRLFERIVTPIKPIRHLGASKCLSSGRYRGVAKAPSSPHTLSAMIGFKFTNSEFSQLKSPAEDLHPFEADVIVVSVIHDFRDSKPDDTSKWRYSFGSFVANMVVSDLEISESFSLAMERAAALVRLLFAALSCTVRSHRRVNIGRWSARSPHRVSSMPLPTLLCVAYRGWFLKSATAPSSESSGSLTFWTRCCRPPQRREHDLNYQFRYPPLTPPVASSSSDMLFLPGWYCIDLPSVDVY